MKLKKIILSLSLLSIGIANASYTVIYPVEHSHIKFKNEPTNEEWIAGTPILGDWADAGEPFSCSLLPSVDDVSIGASFVQTKTCSQNQTQTVRTPETSSITHEVRYTETIKEQVNSIETTQNSIGERYTHIMKVGYYTLAGNNHYRGYLNPNYKSYPDYNNFIEYNSSGLTPNNIGGLELRWALMLVDGNFLLATSNPAVNSNLMAYNITINGVTCSLKWVAYQENFMAGTGCFNINSMVGQNVKMDIRLK